MDLFGSYIQLLFQTSIEHFKINFIAVRSRQKKGRFNRQQFFVLHVKFNGVVYLFYQQTFIIQLKIDDYSQLRFTVEWGYFDMRYKTLLKILLNISFMVN